MFGAYKRYPFYVPLRVKFFNIFRYFFSIRPLEKFLTRQLLIDRSRWWKKFIPPLYFYQQGSIRSATRNGLSYVLDISKLIDHSIYFNDIRDVAWSNLLSLLKREFHVVDAGANVGYLTLQFAKICRDGCVYSFEPDSENFSYLERHVKRNNLNNVRIFKVALGATKGQATLYKLFENNPGANRILHDAPAKNVNHEIVEVMPLDFYQQTFSKIDVVKIDVEGFELFVLKGANEIINRWRPMLFIELAEDNLRSQNYTAADLLRYVEELGYDIIDATTMRPLDHGIKSFHTDIICFPKSQQPI